MLRKNILLSIFATGLVAVEIPPTAPWGSSDIWMSFKSGWNMVSSPKSGKKIEISKLKSSYKDLTTFYEFNTTDYLTPSYIEVGKGYWVYAKKNIDIPSIAYNGLSDSSIFSTNAILSKAIIHKWNLLGTPLDITKSDLISKGALSVWYYDVSTNSYSNSDLIKAGSGFWLKIDPNYKDNPFSSLTITPSNFSIDLNNKLSPVDGLKAISPKDIKDGIIPKTLISSTEGDLIFLQTAKQIEANQTNGFSYSTTPIIFRGNVKNNIILSSSDEKKLYIGNNNYVGSLTYFVTPYLDFPSIPKFNYFIENGYRFITGANIQLKDSFGNDISQKVNLSSTLFEAVLVDMKSIINLDNNKNISEFEIFFYNNGSWLKSYTLTRSSIESNTAINLLSKFYFYPYVIVAKDNIWNTKTIKYLNYTKGTIVAKGVDSFGSDETIIAVKECDINGSDLLCNIRYPNNYTLTKTFLINSERERD